MYLPVLLIRDFGWWSFAAFAIPNCLGAAGFGWAVLTEARSRSLMLMHAPAIRAFALVTVAFQVCFLAWMITHTGAGVAVGAGLLVGGLAGAFAGARAAPTGMGSAMAPRAGPVAGAYVLSLACVVAYAASHPSSAATDWPTDVPGLAWLAPVCALGFALCPFLDPTFHQACQGAWRAGGPGASRRAFSLGFLVLFPLMIGFTLLYAPALLAGATRGQLGTSPPSLAPPIVAFHMALQAAVTAALHLPHARRAASPAVPRTRDSNLIAALVLVALAVLAAFASARTFEVTYRLFMSFYALVFPAYVWICMAPTFRAPEAPGRRRLFAFACAVVVAAPFLGLGFLRGEHWALGPGVLVVLLARLAAGRGEHAARVPSACVPLPKPLD